MNDDYELNERMEAFLDELLENLGYEGEDYDFMREKIIEAMQDPVYIAAMESDEQGEVFLRVDADGKYHIHYVTDPEIMEALDELFGEDPPTIH
jgi:hypothetical protein